MIIKKNLLSNKTIDEDIENPDFFLKLKYFKDFYFFFFFRCLYAISFDLLYIFVNKKKLNINTTLSSDKKGCLMKDCLFVGDSIVSFPVQRYSFPYLFFNNDKAKNVEILAKPGLNSKGLFDYINPILAQKDKKYNTIFIACFLNEIVHTGIGAEDFEKNTKKLIKFLVPKLKKGGKIVYICGDFSMHPIVPDNYFKEYFNYKTNKFISILNKFKENRLELSFLMDFDSSESKEKIKKYFYKDGLHFSKKGQVRLYSDLINNLVC